MKEKLKYLTMKNLTRFGSTIFILGMMIVAAVDMDPWKWLGFNTMIIGIFMLGWVTGNNADK